MKKKTKRGKKGRPKGSSGFKSEFAHLERIRELPLSAGANHPAGPGLLWRSRDKVRSYEGEIREMCVASACVRALLGMAPTGHLERELNYRCKRLFLERIALKEYEEANRDCGGVDMAEREYFSALMLKHSVPGWGRMKKRHSQHHGIPEGRAKAPSYRLLSKHELIDHDAEAVLYVRKKRTQQFQKRREAHLARLGYDKDKLLAEFAPRDITSRSDAANGLMMTIKIWRLRAEMLQDEVQMAIEDKNRRARIRAVRRRDHWVRMVESAGAAPLAEELKTQFRMSDDRFGRPREKEKS